MIHFDMPPMKSNIIKVLGFGGGGSNAVSHMYRQHINNVDFIICNTDSQALATSEVPIKIQLGPHLTQGLGAGANPEVGKQATEESLEEIRRMLEINTKMAFITAGMGGGTGTGGAPTIAKVCKEMGILTVGIVTTPFGFEGPKRMKHAQKGIDELKSYVDTLLVINNDKLRQQYGNLKMKEAFSKADNVLSTATRCITDIINTTGVINVDFADVCTVMKDGGVAILGNAQASGENRALKAIEEAIHSPLLNDNDIRGAKWILLTITSSEGEHEYTMDEVDEIQNYVRNLSGDDTDVLLGIGYDSTLNEELGVTIIATGFGSRDTFSIADAAPKKQEKKEDKVIVGVLGDDATPNAAEKNTPVVAAAPAEVVNTLNPVLVENAAPQIFELPKAEESTEPEFHTLGEEPKAELPVVEEEPEVVTPTIQEELNFGFSIKEEIAAVDTHETLVREVESVLNRPATVYQQEEEQPFVTEPIVSKVEEPRITLQPSTFEAPVAKQETAPKPQVKKLFFEDEETIELGIVEKSDVATDRKLAPQVENYPAAELSEEEEQKRRAQERVDKIRKLRNLSYNFNNSDSGSDFDQVPAYLRRDTDLYNSIANVENFYSRAQVKKDDNNKSSISTINTFLDGNNPD